MNHAFSPRRWSARRCGALLTLASALMLAGCNEDEDQLPTVKVQGTVTVDGEPAEGARVTLHPQGGPAGDKLLRPLATVNPDGTFVVTTYAANDGAPAGEYIVTVHWQLLEYPEGEDADPVLGPNLIDKTYANPSTSDWKVTVAGPTTQLEAIDLPGAVAEAAKQPVQYEE